MAATLIVWIRDEVVWIRRRGDRRRLRSNDLDLDLLISYDLDLSRRRRRLRSNDLDLDLLLLLSSLRPSRSKFNVSAVSGVVPTPLS